MGSPAFRIKTKSGITIADGLAASAPAIRLHEGRTFGDNDPAPFELKPGESVEVSYPLDTPKRTSPREILCTVSCYDAEAVESSNSSPDFVPLPATTSARPRGGRRSRSAS